MSIKVQSIQIKDSITAGCTLKIITGAVAPCTAMAESEDYHLNPYVHIMFTSSPTPAPHNPAISPLTSV